MMQSPLFNLVRFTVTESTLYALLSGNPERRRALRDIEWGSRETDAGEVLVTPPLGAEKAAELRSMFAGAEGVAEIDATGEYTLGYTNAPQDYDGFGTLTLGTAAGERLVAIRTEYLNWQAGRYASGLHRFRPVPPASDSGETAPTGAPSEPPAPERTGADPEVAPPPLVHGVGTVVHMRGRVRRYVVVHVETVGEEARLSMIALSGALKGCYPTAVAVEDVERDADQTVAFAGAAAAEVRGGAAAADRSPPRVGAPVRGADAGGGHRAHGVILMAS